MPSLTKSARHSRLRSRSHRKRKRPPRKGLAALISQPSHIRFLVAWLGQFVSNIGTTLSSFTLGVWLYQQTGSTTQFALSLLAVNLPIVLVAPFAGALVDRFDRRWVMMASDTGHHLFAESSYRCAGQVRGWTTSPNPAYRFVLIALSFVLLNMWVHLRWLFTQVPHRGRRWLDTQRFQLSRLVKFIIRALERHYGCVQGILAAAVPRL